MIHPILFALCLAYSNAPNTYEITPDPGGGYTVVALDAWSGNSLGSFRAGEYQLTDGRYTFRAYGDPTGEDRAEWARLLKGHNGIFWLCSQTGLRMLWVPGEAIHLLA